MKSSIKSDSNSTTKSKKTSKTNSKSKSLKFKLITMILFIVAVSNALLGFISFKITKPAIEKSVEEVLRSNSQSFAEFVYKENEEIFSILHVLAGLDVIKSEEVPVSDKNEVLFSIRSANKNIKEVLFYKKNGEGYENGKLVDFSGKDYVKGASMGVEFISEPAVSDTDELSFYYSVPVYSPRGMIFGILAARVNGEFFSQVCAQRLIGDESHPFIINMRSGRTIADADSSYVKKGQILKNSTQGAMNDAILDAMDGSESYRSFYEPFRQKKMVASYRPVGDNCDWAVFCMAPYNEYFGSITSLVNAMLVLTAAVLLAALILSVITVSRGLKPLQILKESIKEIATGNGDLTKRIKVASKDEIGEVVQGFNEFCGKLQNIISDVVNSKNALDFAGETMATSAEDTAASITQIISNIKDVHSQVENQGTSVEQTAGAVNEIASNIESLVNMIKKQSEQVSQASAAVEEMIGNITSVNQSVDKMASSFDELQKQAQTGAAKQQDVNERVAQIETQSEMLQEANSAISSIAEQTNLLAMNAAIEAAHAGEAGKGFSVVADEIRKLSETSSAQSKTIGEQLSNIKDSINEVVTASQESSDAFSTVSRKIGETDQLVQQIKAAMEEQTIGSQQIGDALHIMNDSTVEVKTASSEMAVGNKAILDEVHNLQEATDAIKISMEQMSSGAKKINDDGTALSGISAQMKDSIQQIGDKINQFKV